jgi:hypothetical protein
MVNTYFIERAVDVMSTPRVTVGRGRFQTSDPHVQRILSGYPGVTLISTEDEPARRPLTPAEGLSLYGPGPEPVRVTAGGVQMKERRPQGGRGTEG